MWMAIYIQEGKVYNFGRVFWLYMSRIRKESEGLGNKGISNFRGCGVWMEEVI